MSTRDSRRVVSGSRQMSRRKVLLGLGSLLVLGGGIASGLELVELGVLPGKHRLEELDGACSVAAPPLRFSSRGYSRSGTFFSRARNRKVGYTLALPPGHTLRDSLPLVVCLHWSGGDHRTIFSGMGVPQAPSLLVNGGPLKPIAFVSADGGQGYWNPHPGDDPMRMIVEELIPMCQRLGLGSASSPNWCLRHLDGWLWRLATGRETPPSDFCRVRSGSGRLDIVRRGAIRESRAYASAASFLANNAVTHAQSLRRVAVRVACGRADPFEPGVQALARRVTQQLRGGDDTGLPRCQFLPLPGAPGTRVFGRASLNGSGEQPAGPCV